MAKKREYKLSLEKLFTALDNKNRNFLGTLEPDELKEFSGFKTARYCANVEGIADLQEWYILAANQRVNRDFFALSRHPKLQWLLCTTVSPGMGRQRHFWLKTNDTRVRNHKQKFIEQMFPHLSNEEIQLTASINSDEELRKTARDLGWDEKRIKDEL